MKSGPNLKLPLSQDVKDLNSTSLYFAQPEVKFLKHVIKTLPEAQRTILAFNTVI